MHRIEGREWKQQSYLQAVGKNRQSQIYKIDLLQEQDSCEKLDQHGFEVMGICCCEVTVTN